MDLTGWLFMWTRLESHRSFMPPAGMTEKTRSRLTRKLYSRLPALPNYIAVATAKLVKEGRLSLDKTLADYFPVLTGQIENSEKITLRMMLQHRSGIPNFVDHPDY